MTNCNGSLVQPMCPINKPMCEVKVLGEDSNYRELIGSLLSTMTRPDITFAVNYLARKIVSPSTLDLAIAKKVLAYLKATSDLGLRYDSKKGKLGIRTFCDSDFAGDPATRRSTTGILIMANDRPIHWATKLQKMAVTSTTEAEIIALSCAAKVGLTLKRTRYNSSRTCPIKMR